MKEMKLPVCFGLDLEPSGWCTGCRPALRPTCTWAAGRGVDVVRELSFVRVCGVEFANGVRTASFWWLSDGFTFECGEKCLYGRMSICDLVYGVWGVWIRDWLWIEVLDLIGVRWRFEWLRDFIAGLWIGCERIVMKFEDLIAGLNAGKLWVVMNFGRDCAFGCEFRPPSGVFCRL